MHASTEPSLFDATDGGDVWEDHTLSLRAGGGPEAYAGALARRLARLERSAGKHVDAVEVDDGSGRYVQLMVDEVDGCWLEAVSNHYLEPPWRLSEAAEGRLRELGLADPDESPNHHLYLPPPVPWDAVAELVVRALVEVYGAGPDDPIRFQIYPPASAEEG